jgi:hypothetical protein
VADAVVAMIGGRAVLRSHPRSRAALLRGAAVWPASALAMLPYLRGIGERRRRRAREPGR